jgi:hypothetical protein
MKSSTFQDIIRIRNNMGCKNVEGFCWWHPFSVNLSLSWLDGWTIVIDFVIICTSLTVILSHPLL